jgi:ribosomal protein S18 acetylase RimI-like enzyme
MTMTFTIRPAHIADCDGIGDIHVAGWQETYGGLMPQRLLDDLSAPARAAMWRQALAREPPVTRLFVAAGASGELLGFCAGGPWRGAARAQDGEIYAIYVLQAGQRRGLGRALMTATAAALHAGGLHSLGLWVLRANTGARSFYQRLGGSVIGERAEVMDGHDLTELAYGWSDMIVLLTPPPPPGRDG